VFSIEIAIYICFELIELVHLCLILALMQLDFSHYVRLNLKLLSLELRFDDREFFLVRDKMFFYFSLETRHLNLHLLHSRCSDYDLRQGVPYLSLDCKLVCSNLMVASYDFLGSLDDFLLEDIETLL
jgi:hypothetical protein